MEDITAGQSPVSGEADHQVHCLVGQQTARQTMLVPTGRKKTDLVLLVHVSIVCTGIVSNSTRPTSRASSYFFKRECTTTTFPVSSNSGGPTIPYVGYSGPDAAPEGRHAHIEKTLPPCESHSSRIAKSATPHRFHVSGSGSKSSKVVLSDRRLA